MKEIEELEFRMKGVDHLSRPLKAAERNVKNLGKQTELASKQMTVFGNKVKDIRKFNMGALQQAGYQVGDYAVQVANGTSKMQAFGQQAPQFLQIFGPIGSVIGAVVAILAAAGVAFQKSSEAAEKAAGKAKTYREQMDMLEASIRALTDAQILNSTNVEMMRKKYGSLTADLREFLKIQRELALIETMEQTTRAFGKLINTKEYIKVVGDLGGLRDDITEAERALALAIEDELSVDEINAFKESLAASEQQFAALNAQLDNMPEGKIMAISEEFLAAAESKNFEGMTSAIVSMRQQIVQLPAVTRQALLPMVVQMEGQMRSLAVAMEPPKLAADAIAEAMVPILDPRHPNYDPIKAEFYKVQQGAEEAKKAVDEVNISMIQMRALKKRGDDPVIFDPRDPRYDKIAVLMAQIREEYENTNNSVSKTKNSVRDLAKTIETKLTPEMKRLRDFGEAVGNSFENSMMSMVDGTVKAKDAFRAMALDIMHELYRIFVVKKVTGFITDFFDMASLPTGKAHTGTEGLPSFAGGGYTGSGARSGGMDGKGGFMAMLHPRETVVDHTKGQGGGVTVVQNINVSTGVQQTVRTEIKSLMPQIANSAKAAVLDAKRRGGSYGKAFA